MRCIQLGLLSFLLYTPAVTGQVVKKSKELSVIAYYSGNESIIERYPVEKLSHVIFSFCHLRGNRLAVDNAEDSATIRKLVSMKSRNPSLKVMLSLGGWGGCRTCSGVFSTPGGREEFASSVKELNDHFHTDGIDLDWEYPAISGYPDHAFMPADRVNFTSLVRELRRVLGKKPAISFAAGGFDTFLLQSVEWMELVPLIDWVNLMSYDLVNGFSKTTGHHTALFSTPVQEVSADHAIGYLAGIGFPMDKIVIGAAFYARTWENVENINQGLYQAGKFKSFVPYNRFVNGVLSDTSFVLFQDDTAKAAYAYSATKKEFATFDDPLSIRTKTEYALQKGLFGIMFWELSLDQPVNGLVDVIDKAKHDR